MLTSRRHCCHCCLTFSLVLEVKSHLTVIERIIRLSCIHRKAQKNAKQQLVACSFRCLPRQLNISFQGSVSMHAHTHTHTQTSQLMDSILVQEQRVALSPCPRFFKQTKLLFLIFSRIQRVAHV